MRPRILITTFSCEYVVRDGEPPAALGEAASDQANTWLADNDVIPVSLATELTPVAGFEGQKLSHIICVAWMARDDWEQQQALIMSHALALRETERIQDVGYATKTRVAEEEAGQSADREAEAG